MVSPIKTFICYAHEDRKTVEAVIKHLRGLERKNTLEIWNDGQILAGQDWDKAIKIRLETAQLILLFVSVDFIDSDYIEKTELKTALERHQRGEVTLIPIIVRACDWGEYFEIGRFQALPNGGKPILSNHFPFIDDAHLEISTGIKATALDLLEKIEKQNKIAQKEAQIRAEQNRVSLQQQQSEKQDDLAWKVTLSAIDNAKSEHDKILAIETYLEEEKHFKYRIEAEEGIGKLNTAIFNKKIEEKQQKEAKKKAADHAKSHSNGAVSRAFPQAPEMVYVVGGIFSFGHREIQVTLDAYRIGKYQVTFEEYDFFCDETNRVKPEDEGWGRGRRPVIYVNWQDCVDYCEWISKRTGLNFHLPTECQWEFAAKGGTFSKGLKYAGSKNLEEVGWFWENSGEKKLTGDWDYDKIEQNNCKTHLVGEKKSNELGLYDLSGNVLEWCNDFYDEGFYEKYVETGVNNPTGSLVEGLRVLRGGSWNRNYRNCRSVYSDGDLATNYDNDVGFRLAQD
jgi:formylglycine-generating enzyme